MKETHHSAKDGGTTIMEKLAVHTKKRHEELSSLPFFKALIDHKLPLDSYVNQLRVLAVIHSVLEQEVESADYKRIKMVWREDLEKFHLLQNDLAFFEPRTIRDSNAALDEAYEFTRKIRRRRIEVPETLAAYIYVFEGTTLGNHMHEQDVLDNFKLVDGYGSKYYRSYGEGVHDHWEEFKTRMNKAFPENDSHQDIIDAAFEVFDGLERIYKKLYPIDKKGLSSHVARINPLAGNHPIPEDDREIDAALKASNAAWKEFPYYENRFGERGKLFSDSDICWLASLSKLEKNQFHQQIKWFSNVLSSRGMPTILLETTLFELGGELTSAVPENAELYEKFISEAKHLQKTRQDILTNEMVSPVFEVFNQKVGPELAKKHRDCVLLLAGAVYDSGNGVEESLPSFLAWAKNEDTFPPKWIRAVDEAVEKLTKTINT